MCGTSYVNAKLSRQRLCLKINRDPYPGHSSQSAKSGQRMSAADRGICIMKPTLHPHSPNRKSEPENCDPTTRLEAANRMHIGDLVRCPQCRRWHPANRWHTEGTDYTL